MKGMQHSIDQTLLQESDSELYENAPCGYLYTSPDGAIVKVNQTFVSWTGYSRGELAGRPLIELLEPGGRIFYETHLAPLLNLQGSANEIALDLVCKNGALVPVLITATQKRDSMGAPQFNRITIFNATERRLYERELLSARRQAERTAADLAAVNAQLALSNTALLQSEQRVRSILDGVIAFAGIIDSEGKLVEVNRTLLAAASIKANDVLGKPFEDAYWWSYSDAVRQRMQEAVAQARRGVSARFDVQARIADDRFLDLDFSLIAVKDAAGNVTHLIPSGVDITERKRAEESLKLSNSRLLTVNEELAQFAYIASHDLQEPLRTLSSYTQLLARKNKGRLDDESDLFIRYILENASRMRELVSGLLLMSQAETSTFTFRSTALEQTFNIALLNLQTAVEENEAMVTHDVLPCVLADPARMTQVLQNLIGNAIKYRSPEKPPRVHVWSRELRGEWMIAVRDNGVGFEQQYSEQIFGIFKRLHGRDVPGAGIGLAICKRIVEGHGGRIWAESAPGAGSTFHFTLPA
jgi:PAS domain S-box-containing protein